MNSPGTGAYVKAQYIKQPRSTTGSAKVPHDAFIFTVRSCVSLLKRAPDRGREAVPRT